MKIEKIRRTPGPKPIPGGKPIYFLCGGRERAILERVAEENSESLAAVLRRAVRLMDQPTRSAS